MTHPASRLLGVDQWATSKMLQDLGFDATTVRLMTEPCAVCRMRPADAVRRGFTHWPVRSGVVYCWECAIPKEMQ